MLKEISKYLSETHFVMTGLPNVGAAGMEAEQFRQVFSSTKPWWKGMSPRQTRRFLNRMMNSSVVFFKDIPMGARPALPEDFADHLDHIVERLPLGIAETTTDAAV